MRYSEFWAEVLSQNSALKVAVFSLSIITVLLTGSLLAVSMREPLVFDRECLTKAVALSDPKHTDREIDQFVRTVLVKRFDPVALDAPLFLSASELSSRQREMEELSKKGMSQNILISLVKIDTKSIFVNADRIISIGHVRSALPLKLTLKLRVSDRSPGNPFGLILDEVAAATSSKEQE